MCVRVGVSKHDCVHAGVKMLNRFAVDIGHCIKRLSWYTHTHTHTHTHTEAQFVFFCFNQKFQDKENLQINVTLAQKKGKMYALAILQLVLCTGACLSCPFLPARKKTVLTWSRLDVCWSHCTHTVHITLWLPPKSASPVCNGLTICFLVRLQTGTVMFKRTTAECHSGKHWFMALVFSIKHEYVLTLLMLFFFPFLYFS